MAASAQGILCSFTSDWCSNSQQEPHKVRVPPLFCFHWALPRVLPFLYAPPPQKKHWNCEICQMERKCISKWKPNTDIFHHLHRILYHSTAWKTLPYVTAVLRSTFTAGAIKCESHCPMRIDKVLRMPTMNTAPAVGMKEEINTVSSLLLHLLRLKCKSWRLVMDLMLSETLRFLIKAIGFNNVATSETRTAHLTKAQPVLHTD